MPWTITDERLGVYHWAHPAGEVWLYPSRNGWALCAKDGSVRIFRSRNSAIKHALAPALEHAKSRLAHYQAKAQQATTVGDFKVRGSALRWAREWADRLGEIRTALSGPQGAKP